MKILVIDNYDSFVYNLVHILHSLGVEDITVRKNDQITLEEIKAFDKILLSPGPGVPKDAGIMPALIREFAEAKSIFGVCLGHQAISEAFGAKIENLKEPLHGVSSQLSVLTDDYLFDRCPQQFKVGHYHSWITSEDSLNDQLIVTSKDERGYIMSLAHKSYDVRGVQFHPESVLTENGVQMLLNWLNYPDNQIEQSVAADYNFFKNPENI
jgi:anthranilate synthase component 2